MNSNDMKDVPQELLDVLPDLQKQAVCPEHGPMRVVKIQEVTDEGLKTLWEEKKQ